MEEIFVPFGLADRLMVEGYDTYCFGIYVEGKLKTGSSIGYPSAAFVREVFSGVLAPTYDQVLLWLRIESRIRIDIKTRTSGKTSYNIWKWIESESLWRTVMYDDKTNEFTYDVFNLNSYTDYYEAVNIAIWDVLTFI